MLGCVRIFWREPNPERQALTPGGYAQLKEIRRALLSATTYFPCKRETARDNTAPELNLKRLRSPTVAEDYVESRRV
jgi:hypothetical protein